jgi:hypothetical protein
MLPTLAHTASKRKLRLFACACCRRIWHLLTDPRLRHAVEVAARFADGQATDEERAAAWSVATAIEPPAVYSASRATAARAYARYVAAAATAGYANDAAASAIADYAATPKDVQCELLRDIFGNPFRPLVLDSAWLHNGGVRELAQAIYDNHRLGDLPLLADALLEVGCTDRDILSHRRSRGEHARGCFAVDLVLGQA